MMNVRGLAGALSFSFFHANGFASFPLNPYTCAIRRSQQLPFPTRGWIRELELEAVSILFRKGTHLDVSLFHLNYELN